MFPFYKDEILFIPQLFYKEIFLPFGIQSTQIHLNNWNDNYFDKFENFINENQEKISNFNDIIELKNQNSFKLITNYLVEKIVKCVRFIR